MPKDRGRTVAEQSTFNIEDAMNYFGIQRMLEIMAEIRTAKADEIEREYRDKVMLPIVRGQANRLKEFAEKI